MLQFLCAIPDQIKSLSISLFFFSFLFLLLQLVTLVVIFLMKMLDQRYHEHYKDRCSPLVPLTSLMQYQTHRIVCTTNLLLPSYYPIMDESISWASIPEDIAECIFENAVQPPSKYHVSVRAASRCIDASQLIFTSKSFSNCFFDSVRVLDLDKTFNYSIDTVAKLYSFLQRCQKNLTQLSLKSFKFRTLSTKVEQSARPPTRLSFPSLQVLTLDNCNPLIARYLLLSINGDRLHTLRVNSQLLRFERKFIRKFFSKHLLQIINNKFGRLIHLDLVRLSIMPGFINENNKYPLLERLESLSLIDLKFDNDVDLGKFLGVFQNQCKRLSVLNLRLQAVGVPAVVNLCVGLKKTLSKLHLLSNDVLWSGNESPLLSDEDAIRIIDNCKNLVSIHISRNDFDNKLIGVYAPVGVPSEMFLTSAWVKHAVKVLGLQLEHIGISHLPIRRGVFEDIRRECLSLRSINLRRCIMSNIRFNEFKKFFKSRGARLECLDVTGCVYMYDRHLKVLGKFLSPSVLKTLRIATLDDCYDINVLKKLLRRTCSGLEILELYDSAYDVSAPISIMEIIQNNATKKKLKVILERPQESSVYNETLKKMGQMQNEFPELLLRLQTLSNLKSDEFHV